VARAEGAWQQIGLLPHRWFLWFRARTELLRKQAAPITKEATRTTTKKAGTTSKQYRQLSLFESWQLSY